MSTEWIKLVILSVYPTYKWSQAALSEVKRSNYVYKVSNLDQWRMLMGG